MSAPAGLVGRTRECRALDDLLTVVRGGDARVLIVRGDAGIGKSALLKYLVGAAAGFKVLRVTGVESEMELPFAGLQQLCAPVLDRLASLPDPQQEAARVAFGLAIGSAPDRLLTGLAALHLLSTATEGGPLLCLIDDAQWLDRASAQALTFVARRLDADSVGLVFATRDTLSSLSGFPELQVEGLNEGDAQTLLSAVLHVPLDERVRDRIVAESHGNPLALVEWPRGRSAAELGGGFVTSPLTSGPGHVEANYRRRIAELPPATQQFLTLAAAEPTGDPVIVWRAARELGVEPHDASPAIDADLIDIGVQVRFRNPVARSVAYEAAALTDRQAAHRALALATDPEGDPDRRAWHRALGSPVPDEDVAVALERSAARARARGGLAAVGALLDRAVALTSDPARRGPRILAAASAHLDAGAFDVAAGLLASAEAAPLDEMGRVRLDILRGRLASAGGDVRNAPALLLRAAQRLEPLDAGGAADVYLQAMGAANMAGSFARGVRFGDIADAASIGPASAARTPTASLVAAFAQVAVESPCAGASRVRAVLNATDARAPVPFYFFSFAGGAAALVWDLPAFHRITALHLEATRAIGALTMLPWALNTVALLRTLDGDFEGAASALVEANEIVEATGGNVGMTWSQALVAGCRADADALHVLEHLAEHGRAAGNAQVLKHAVWGTAILHNGRGQYERAVAVSEEVMLQPADWGTHMFFHERIEAAARSGQRAVAAATLERLRETTEPSGTDWAIGIQRRSEALLAEGTAVEDNYREAIERLSRTSLRPELARAHLLYGEWLRRENRRVDARTELRTGYDMFSAMGMRAFAERTGNELQATGETVRKRRAETFDELTPQEAHIARLAADGSTNPEIGAQLFISPRTVEWHLRKVFTKLGVSSRRELRRALPPQSG